MGYSQKVVQQDIQIKQKELTTLLARENELDGLFEKIYEDNVSGKLSDDRFNRMGGRYEDEQVEVQSKIKTLKVELQKGKSQTMTGDMFISAVRKYSCVRKLTPRMLNELIEKNRGLSLRKEKRSADPKYHYSL